MKGNNKKALALAIFIPLAVGGLSSLLSGGMSVYSEIKKPALAPPGFIFPIVWIILYILMGISSYLIYKSTGPNKEGAFRLYALQLFFNFCWSIVFFRFQWFFFAFLWLLILDVMICLMISRFKQINPLAGYLQIPALCPTVNASITSSSS